MLLNRTFNKNSENVLKTVFFLFQADFTYVLSLTDLLNCVSEVSVSSNFDTGFLPDCTKSRWMGNLIKIPKMCLKQSFSYFKWVLPAILSLMTVLSNYVSSNSNFDTLLFLTVLNFVGC